MDKFAKDGVITIGNDGGDIKETNYFQTPQSLEGIIFFSVNGGCIRALVPESMAEVIPEMKTGKEVIISRGPMPSQGIDDAFEIMFDDHSDTPFSISVSVGQWDMLPEADDRWSFTAWGPGGKVFECDRCMVRHVDKLPWLKPW